MGMSDYLEQRVADFTFRANAGFSWTAPTTIYVALFTTATADDGSGTEVSGGSYARQSIAFNSMSGVTDGQTENTSQINFPQATANWGTVTHAALMDASTGGNMLCHTALDTSKTVNSGDTFKIAASAFVIDLT